VGNETTGKTTTLGNFVEATPIDVLGMMEIQKLSQQSRQAVVSSLDRLAESNPSADRVLFLLYGLKLTQADAGVDLGINQATVMRRRDRNIGELAKQLHKHLLPNQALTAKELEPLIEYVKFICSDYYY
jgi:DNA-directed RNA polymerase specialized sigma24 family protein